MAKKFTQGLYKPVNPSKFIGGSKDIVYRSSWELTKLFKLDTDPKVLRIGSENVIIPYQDVSGTIRRYFVDLYVERLGIDDKLIKELIEIKPHKETIPPVLTEGKKTKTKIREILTWDVNSRKWAAARKYCEKKGWQFRIVTEYELGLKKR